MIRYFLILLIVFGPKAFGMVDSRLLLLPFILVCDFRKTLRLILPLMLLILVSFASFMISGVIIGENVLRLLRVIILCCITESVTRMFRIQSRTLGLVLLTQALVIVGMFISPFFYDIIRNIIGFTKGIKEFRYFGLVLGYDLSGLIVIISMVHILIYNKNKVLAFVTWLVSLLTSRVTMVFSTGGLLLYLWKNTPNYGKYLSIFLIILMTWISWPILSPYFSQLLAIFGFIEGDVHLNGYAIYSINSLLDQVLAWPSGIGEWLLGGSVIRVDGGWSMLLLRYGILGGCLVLYFYSILWRKLRSDTFGKFLILSVILLSIKNEYFLTRNITEIILVYYFIRINESSFFAKVR